MSTIETDERTSVSLLNGEFRDAELERGFLEFRHQSDRHRLRWIVGAMIGLSLLFAYIDWSLSDSAAQFARLSGIRAFGLIGPVLLVILAGRLRSASTTQRAAFGAALTFLASMVWISTELPPDPVSIAVAGTLILSTYTIIPMSFPQRVIAAGGYSIACAVWLVPPLDPSAHASNFFLLVMVNVLGIVADRATGNARRREYLLLHRIFPETVILRMQRGERVADEYAAVSILFADLVGFTGFSARLGPREVVGFLDRLFERFDSLCDQHRVEKIKTIGDSYMAAAGLPRPRPDHAQALISLAQDMLAAVHEIGGGEVQLRIGIHSGPVFAGVIGSRRQLYDVWGDTVNLASRMESQGVVDGIQISLATRELLSDEEYRLEERGSIDVKGRGAVPVFIVRGT